MDTRANDNGGMDARASENPVTAENGFLGRSVHLIGIGGSGMRALARMLIDSGAVVSGSDQAPGGAVDRLIADGADIRIGQRGENLPERLDAVVHSAAIDPQNPELLAARRRGVAVLKYAEMLGRLMESKVGIAVAGTHGKSTTTAMTAYALREGGLDPSFIVGATVDQLGGPSGVGAGRHFLAEACEFDRSFLNLHPQYAAILNIEEDHLDCYRDLGAIIEAFRAFAAGMKEGGVLVVNGEDRNSLEAVREAACEVQTFGLAENCHWRGVERGVEHGRWTLEVRKAGETFVTLRVPLPGLHNAYNALATTALLHHAGLERRAIAPALEGFTGARRRMSLKGVADGITVVDDYAHHPTEIQATLKALAAAYEPRRIVCVFQPHQHSRTRFLLKDFAQSFALADEVIVPEIYFVRDSEQEKDHISAEDLVAQIRLRGGEAVYRASFEEILDHLESGSREGDLVVTMGAGNIWEVADAFIQRLG